MSTGLPLMGEALGLRESGASPIPHNFHFVWLGGDPPSEFNTYMTGWMDKHPEWRFFLWDDSDMRGLQNQDLFDRAEEIAPKHYQQLRCDIARLEILREFGGVYVDFDFECLKSIESLVSPNNPLPSRRRDPVRFFAAWEEQNVWVNNAIMGSEPGYGFLDVLIEGLPENVEQFRGYKPNKLSGPQYLTRKLNEYGIQEDGLIIFPQEAFYPYGWNELHRGGEEFPYAYAVHHWNNKRSGG